MGLCPGCLGITHGSGGGQITGGQKMEFEMIKYRAEDRRLKSEMGIWPPAHRGIRSTPSGKSERLEERYQLVLT
jgi:hypothetical protein